MQYLLVLPHEYGLDSMVSVTPQKTLFRGFWSSKSYSDTVSALADTDIRDIKEMSNVCVFICVCVILLRKDMKKKHSQYFSQDVFCVFSRNRAQKNPVSSQRRDSF